MARWVKSCYMFSDLCSCASFNTHTKGNQNFKGMCWDKLNLLQQVVYRNMSKVCSNYTENKVIMKQPFGFTGAIPARFPRSASLGSAWRFWSSMHPITYLAVSAPTPHSGLMGLFPPATSSRCSLPTSWWSSCCALYQAHVSCSAPTRAHPGTAVCSCMTPLL